MEIARQSLSPHFLCVECSFLVLLETLVVLCCALLMVLLVRGFLRVIVFWKHGYGPLWLLGILRIGFCSLMFYRHGSRDV